MPNLDALAIEHSKKKQQAMEAHAAKVKILEGALAKNSGTLTAASLERNKASDDFHKTTKLRGLEFVAALEKLHEDIDKAAAARLVEVPEGRAYGEELAQTLSALDNEFNEAHAKIAQDAASADATALLVVPVPSAEETAATTQADAANEGIYQVLVKAGAKPEDLKIALGIESAEARAKARPSKPSKSLLQKALKL